MRISVFTREEQETKKDLHFIFYNLVLDQLQVYSDLTYFRNGDTDLVWQRSETCKVLEHHLNLFFLGFFYILCGLRKATSLITS